MLAAAEATGGEGATAAGECGSLSHSISIGENWWCFSAAAEVWRFFRYLGSRRTRCLLISLARKRLGVCGTLAQRRTRGDGLDARNSRENF